MPELRAVMTDDLDLKQLRRTELEQALLESNDEAFFERLTNGDTLLQVLRADEYLLCQMLFFGNLNQSMTDFVLRDLGLYQFESYNIDTEHRPRSRNTKSVIDWFRLPKKSIWQSRYSSARST